MRWVEQQARRMCLDELNGIAEEIAKGTPMKPKAVLAEGYRVWCVVDAVRQRLISRLSETRVA